MTQIASGILKDLLDEGGISYKQNGKSFIMQCPRCRKREKLYIRKTDGRFVCWYCRETDGFQGAPEYVFRELLSRNLDELCRVLYGDEKTETALYLDLQLLEWFDGDDDDEIPIDIPRQQEVLPDPGFRTLDTDAGAPGRQYLSLRGIPIDVALQYDIQYWPEKGRVIFPVKSQGKWLGWQARYIRETQWFDEEVHTPVSVPKILTSAGTKRDQVLMFGDRISGDHAVLCEGPVDALKAHYCGGNVATMGKAVSRQQLQLLRNAGVKRLYLALDPDAFRDAQKLLQEVDDMEFYDLRPPEPHKDLGDMTMEQVHAIFTAAPRIDRGFLYIYLRDHYGVR